MIVKRACTMFPLIKGHYDVPVTKGSATNLKGGGNALEWGGVNTVETLKFEKGGGGLDPSPPSSYGGAAPAYMLI